MERRRLLEDVRLVAWRAVHVERLGKDTAEYFQLDLQTVFIV